MTFKKYDPDKVSVLVGGTRIKGFANIETVFVDRRLEPMETPDDFFERLSDVGLGFVRKPYEDNLLPAIQDAFNRVFLEAYASGLLLREIRTEVKGKIEGFRFPNILGDNVTEEEIKRAAANPEPIRSKTRLVVEMFDVKTGERIEKLDLGKDFRPGEPLNIKIEGSVEV